MKSKSLPDTFQEFLAEHPESGSPSGLLGLAEDLFDMVLSYRKKLKMALEAEADFKLSVNNLEDLLAPVTEKAEQLVGLQTQMEMLNQGVADRALCMRDLCVLITVALGQDPDQVGDFECSTPTEGADWVMSYLKTMVAELIGAFCGALSREIVLTKVAEFYAAVETWKNLAAISWSCQAGDEGHISGDFSNLPKVHIPGRRAREALEHMGKAEELLK